MGNHSRADCRPPAARVPGRVASVAVAGAHRYCNWRAAVVSGIIASGGGRAQPPRFSRFARMNFAIHGLGTANPPDSVTPTEGLAIARLLAGPDVRTSTWLGPIYTSAGVDRRF